MGIGIQILAVNLAVLLAIRFEGQRSEGLGQLSPSFCIRRRRLHLLGIDGIVAGAFARDRTDVSVAVLLESLDAFGTNELLGRVVHHAGPLAIGMCVEPFRESLAGVG